VGTIAGLDVAKKFFTLSGLELTPGKYTDCVIFLTHLIPFNPLIIRGLKGIKCVLCEY
jgi:hypothetical protein